MSEYLNQFEQLNTIGHAAKDAGDHERALSIFEEADQLALDHGDPTKRMHALTPAARALWSLGRYDQASETLETVFGIATDLGLEDERGIAVSNIGRIAAVKIIDTVPVAAQKQALLVQAVPHFKDAYHILSGHPHLYYRYANAQHGSVVSALAGDRKLARRLISEGFGVAFRVSAEPYDQIPTYRINAKGLGQMAAAAALIPLGNETLGLVQIARQRLIR